MIPLVSDFNPTSAVGGRFLCHRKHCQAHQSPVALALETHWSGHFHCLFGELVPNSMWVTFRVRSTGWWVLWLFKAGGGRRDGGAPLVAAKRALNKREGERKTHPVTNTQLHYTHTYTHTLSHTETSYMRHGSGNGSNPTSNSLSSRLVDRGKQTDPRHSE